MADGKFLKVRHLISSQPLNQCLYHNLIHNHYRINISENNIKYHTYFPKPVICVNCSSEDLTTNYKTVYGGDPLYFHAKVVGGDGTSFQMYRVITFPDGDVSEPEYWTYKMTGGETTWVAWKNGIYNIPQTGQCGYLTMSFYHEDGTLLGSGKVYIGPKTSKELIVPTQAPLSVEVVCVNDSETDWTTNYKTIYGGRKTVFHYRVMGGDGTEFDLYKRVTFPDGYVSELEFLYTVKTGGTIYWENGIYKNPEKGVCGYLTVDFYLKDGTHLGSGRVYIGTQTSSELIIATQSPTKAPTPTADPGQWTKETAETLYKQVQSMEEYLQSASENCNSSDVSKYSFSINSDHIFFAKLYIDQALGELAKMKTLAASKNAYKTSSGTTVLDEINDMISKCNKVKSAEVSNNDEYRLWIVDLKALVVYGYSLQAVIYAMEVDIITS